MSDDHFPDSLLCDEQLLDDCVQRPVSPTIPAAIPASELETELDDPSFIERLLDSERQYMPHPNYLRSCRERVNHQTTRQDCISYILKIHATFRFKPVTAFLCINYFDRFLSSHALPESGWPFQLLSVACLSLAAKMEEMYVPLLGDLQLYDSEYIFEPISIQRMELCITNSLKWRLRSVTPFDYLHHFISKSNLSNTAKVDTIHSVASDLILNSTRVIDFLRFAPSVIAAAAIISASGGNLNLPDNFNEKVNREMVRSCHQLLEEYIIDTCPSDCVNNFNTGQPVPPPSPIGVLDAAACVSCSTHAEIPSPLAGSAADETEPEAKRQRSCPTDVHEPNDEQQ